MEPEQLQNFNDRLSQWVASQGFWFQVRYSMSGSGMKGRAMFHLLRMGARLLVFLLLVAVGTWVYLVKRTDGARFNEALRKDLQAGLSASESGDPRVQPLAGEVGNQPACGGWWREIRFSPLWRPGTSAARWVLLDGLVGVWQPGIISIARLDVDLRAGSDDAESARKLSEAVFRKSAKVDASAFEVGDATLRWGYSERTEGAIENSSMKMQRTESGWRINFKGGTFRQNWLQEVGDREHGRGLRKGRAVIRKGGTEARSRHGRFFRSALGWRRAAADRWRLPKSADLTLEEILPPALRSFVEGSISGDFKVFGSTNTSDGVGFEGQVTMDGTNSISSVSASIFSRRFRWWTIPETTTGSISARDRSK